MDCVRGKFGVFRLNLFVITIDIRIHRLSVPLIKCFQMRYVIVNGLFSQFRRYRKKLIILLRNAGIMLPVPIDGGKSIAVFFFNEIGDFTESFE